MPALALRCASCCCWRRRRLACLTLPYFTLPYFALASTTLLCGSQVSQELAGCLASLPSETTTTPRRRWSNCSRLCPASGHTPTARAGKSSASQPVSEPAVSEPASQSASQPASQPARQPALSRQCKRQVEQKSKQHSTSDSQARREAKQSQRHQDASQDARRARPAATGPCAPAAPPHLATGEQLMVFDFMSGVCGFLLDI